MILFGVLGVLGVVGCLVAVQEHGGLAGIRAIIAQARNRTTPPGCECGHTEIMHSPIFGLCETLTSPFGTCPCQQFQPEEH